MKRVVAVVLACGLCGFAATERAHAALYEITPIMSGLVTPRGLTFGRDGALYVAEAGSGGTGPTVIAGNNATLYFGNSSALTRWAGGVQTRVLSGLPSLATASGGEATGLQDIAFASNGQAYGLFAFGSTADQRSANLGMAGANLGTVTLLNLANGSVGPRIADFALHEFNFNPDGSRLRDSNPFSLALTANGNFLVADSGGNTFLRASPTGDITTLGVLPAKPNPLPIGPPVYQSVPTAIEVGPDGAYYIGQLTGFPFPAGAANVYRYDPVTGTISEAYSGFTNIIDIAFDAEGDLLVLELSANGLTSPNGPGFGALFKIDTETGVRTLIASEGLLFPGGLAIGPDGAYYVSTRTNVPNGGQVLRIAQVPEPSTLGLLAAGLLGLANLRRRSASR